MSAGMARARCGGPGYVLYSLWQWRLPRRDDRQCSRCEQRVRHVAIAGVNWNGPEAPRRTALCMPGYMGY